MIHSTALPATQWRKVLSRRNTFYALGVSLQRLEQVVMHQRALGGCEKVLGLVHISIFDTVNNVGILYADQRALAEART